MHHLPAHIDKLCQCLVRSGTAIHTGDVEKLLLSMTVVDDKFRTEGPFTEFVIHIVGVEDVSLARQDRPGFLGEELVNDRGLLASVRVDPSDTHVILRGQGVDEVCFTRERIRIKVGNGEDCRGTVGMGGIDRQESTEGTFLVEDGKDMSGVGLNADDSLLRWFGGCGVCRLGLDVSDEGYDVVSDPLFFFGVEVDEVNMHRLGGSIDKLGHHSTITVGGR
mmetsp:Transcript_6786/g.6609  ORF Transcript_6786/g.6609 Transcript_6786/m.6609 type:complete len:221 (-) Transcript_6786:510-1172(-)